MENVPYRSILGSLIYLSTRTTPDIATAVSMLGKFQGDPGISDWKAMKHLPQYLKGPVHYSISLCTFHLDQGMHAYSDVDWSRDGTARRSRPGILVLYGDPPSFWLFKIQSATAPSTTEAERAALATCVREFSWLCKLLEDIGSPESGETLIRQETFGAIRWTEDVQGLRNVKHVGIKYHFVRSMVESGTVNIDFTSLATNRTDSLTKILGSEMHAVHRQHLWVIA